MSGTLYVVATPIGNLEDITLRALRVLREVSVIAAEDTRRTARLLSAHAISTRTVSFHEHNTAVRLPQLIARLERGEDVGLVSDAGTPGISDPGLELVQGCIKHGIRVDPIPGASAPLTALVASGLPMIPFTIYGFPPSRLKDRMNWMAMVSGTKHTFSFFESPHRIDRTLSEASPFLAKRPIVVARELTKVHQELIYLRSLDQFVLGNARRGEFTVLVGPALDTARLEGPAASDEDIVAEFKRIENTSASRREATRLVGTKYGISQKIVYAALERALVFGRKT